MSRIKDTIYIEDTLITCAEYQLFIDEMRIQGRYFHPDHWNSYQFKTGQAQMPVLGVRFSDALVFCEWLTRRENDGWRYRLPTFEEAKSNPLKVKAAYWATKLENTPEIILMDDQVNEKINLSILLTKTLTNADNFINTLLDDGNSIHRLLNVDVIGEKISNMDNFMLPKDSGYLFDIPSKEKMINIFNNARGIVNTLKHLVMRDTEFNVQLDADIYDYIYLADILSLYAASRLDNIFQIVKKEYISEDDQIAFPDIELIGHLGELLDFIEESISYAESCDRNLSRASFRAKRFVSTASFDDIYNIAKEIYYTQTFIDEINANLTHATYRGPRQIAHLTNDANCIKSIFKPILGLIGITLLIVLLEARRTDLYPANEGIRIVKEQITNTI